MFHTSMRELIHMRESLAVCQFRTTWAWIKLSMAKNQLGLGKKIITCRSIIT